MHDETVKLVLAYELASFLHETWRAPRKRADGSYSPSIKKSTDEEWIKEHNTDEVDVANTSFENLPSDWQKENLEAAKVAIELVYEKINNGRGVVVADLEKMGEVIHEEWLKRNTWVHNKLYGYSKLAVPFKELPRDEQDRHKAQIMPAAKLVREYFAGLVDIEELGKKYNVDTSGYFKTKSFKNEG